MSTKLSIELDEEAGLHIYRDELNHPGFVFLEPVDGLPGAIIEPEKLDGIERHGARLRITEEAWLRLDPQPRPDYRRYRH